jgi:hypothetical protein
MANKKEKSLTELIEDAEDKLAEASHSLQKVKEKIEDEEEMDEFERGLP